MNFNATQVWNERYRVKKNYEDRGKLEISAEVTLPNNILFVWKIDGGNTSAFMSKIDRHITLMYEYIKRNIIVLSAKPLHYILYSFFFNSLSSILSCFLSVHAHAGHSALNRACPRLRFTRAFKTDYCKHLARLTYANSVATNSLNERARTPRAMNIRLL